MCIVWPKAFITSEHCCGWKHSLLVPLQRRLRVLHASVVGTCLALLYQASQCRCWGSREWLLNTSMASISNSTSCTLQRIWPCADQSRDHMQASDFMIDEEGTRELCRHAARWLFGPQRILLPKPYHASDLASQEYSVPSEKKIQVRSSS